MIRCTAHPGLCRLPRYRKVFRLSGHFMGKKSVVDSAFSPPEDDAMSAYEVALNPQKVEPDDLYQEVLKIALQARLDSQESRAKIPETALLMKILESYIQGNRK
ncbi:hypothetical protein P4O66_006870 [Electrophorus voltai]|uniref:Uncharacterized protein n=1 Tax=Electrophorus voltai TaxID=2609070 RepID=A0AAD9DX12_9TELE|nr:hypothetical protein P4O66_006870 [Electrophorus voltai]